MKAFKVLTFNILGNWDQREGALWHEREGAVARTISEADADLVGLQEAMFDQRGQPNGELFGEDGLHMNAAGYQLWTSIVRPRLAADLGL